MSRGSLLLLAFAGCAPKAQHLDSIALSVDGVAVEAEVADTEARRELGLMYRDTLPKDHGMLFVYPDEQMRGYWMKNTKVPLSIAFMNAQGRVVHTAEMAAMDESVVPSRFPATYALEMSQDWFIAHNVQPGDMVNGLPGPSKE